MTKLRIFLKSLTKHPTMGEYPLPMWQRVSGTRLHFPGRVYGLCLVFSVKECSHRISCELHPQFVHFDAHNKHLPQVGKMKRKFGPRPSQEVRRNPRQSRSDRHSFIIGILAIYLFIAPFANLHFRTIARIVSRS